MRSWSNFLTFFFWWAVPIFIFLQIDTGISRMTQSRNTGVYTMSEFLVPVPERVTFFGKEVPFNIYGVWDDVSEWIRFFTNSKNRWRMEMYIALSKDFFSYIDSIFVREGIHSDARYFAVGESEMNPNAVSAKHAVGVWQFIKTTGEKNGLKITTMIDERREIIASTHAACKEMRANFNFFRRIIADTAECWWLSLAAYNTGLGRVQKALQNDGETSYFLLSSIPRETERYLPLMIALKMIMEYPERYGFSDRIMYNGPKMEFLRKKFKTFTPWKSVVPELRREGYVISLKELRRANTHITHDGGIPRGEYILRIPIKKE